MTIGIICHDAGGAEILSSYCKVVRDDFIFTLEGPAVSIFSRKLGNISNRNLETTIQNSDEIYTGTSGKSNLERLAIQMARERKIESKSFLDHWINYELRFTDSNGVRYLPDTIVVGDKYAEKLARDIFPGQVIQLIPNPYWKSIRKDFSLDRKNQKQSKECIFVSEGLDELNEYLNINYNNASIDLRLVQELHNNLHKIDPLLENIRIRRHPSEPKDKFHSLIGGLPDVFSMSNENTELVEELSGYSTVIGYQSMALVVALQMGLRVVSIRLPEMPEIQLPFEEIERLVLTI